MTSTVIDSHTIRYTLFNGIFSMKFYECESNFLTANQWDYLQVQFNYKPRVTADHKFIINYLLWSSRFSFLSRTSTGSLQAETLITGCGRLDKIMTRWLLKMIKFFGKIGSLLYTVFENGNFYFWHHKIRTILFYDKNSYFKDLILTNYLYARYLKPKLLVYTAWMFQCRV